MMARVPIAIVGGGLAGLTLGIGLRRRGVPVTVWEAGRYPRHRVCGEFISGRGLDSLERCGLAGALEAAGARPARTAAFFSEQLNSPVLPLPRPALSLSRQVLDALLAGEFVRLGGELLVNRRWTGSMAGPGVVRASGRSVCAAVDGWRWLGLKAHARGVTLAADLEMHVTSAGYVGLCRLADETVNVCGLFRCRTPQPDLAQRWREQLGGGPGTPLQARLRGAQWDEASFCSVSGLSLKPRTAAGRAECCVGDAVTMIAPVTGNGMSMAFESAELAVDPLVAFSEGRRPWAAARAAIATRCDRRFRVRLFTSAAMQRALVWRPEAGEWLVRALGWRMIWRAAFASTR